MYFHGFTMLGRHYVDASGYMDFIQFLLSRDLRHHASVDAVHLERTGDPEVIPTVLVIVYDSHPGCGCPDYTILRQEIHIVTMDMVVVAGIGVHPRLIRAEPPT